MPRNKEHVLKTEAHYWDAAQAGEKTFEVRRNDRGFQTGDTLILRRMSNTNPQYYDSDSSPIKYRITYILQGGQFGIEPGFCVMGISPEQDNEGSG